MYGNRRYGQYEYGALGISSIAYTKSLSDTLTLSEVYTALAHRFSSFAETLDITDALSRAITRLWAEIATVTDSLSTLTVRPISFSDEADVIDSGLVKEISRALSDDLSITEIHSKSATRRLSDEATVTDTVSKSYTDIVLDLIPVSDTVKRGTGVSRVDDISTTDSMNRGWILTKSDIENMSDTRQSNRGKVFADVMTIREVYNYIINGISGLWHKMTRTTALWTKLQRKD